MCLSNLEELKYEKGYFIGEIINFIFAYSQLFLSSIGLLNL